MKKILAVLLIVLIFASFPLFSEDIKFYSKGSQYLSFKGGVIFPGVIDVFNGSETKWFFDTNLTVGGDVGVSYQVFLNPDIAFGGEVGYIFSYSKANTLFTSIPVTAKLTWFPVQGKFEIPLSVMLGASYNTYSSHSLIAPVFGVEVGVGYYWSNEWGALLKVGALGYLELYTGDKSTSSAFAGFLPLTVAITYRH